MTRDKKKSFLRTEALLITFIDFFDQHSLLAATVTFPAAFLVDDGRLTAFRTKITILSIGFWVGCHSS
jgi:hypothetical protein